MIDLYNQSDLVEDNLVNRISAENGDGNAPRSPYICTYRHSLRGARCRRICAYSLGRLAMAVIGNKQTGSAVSCSVLDPTAFFAHCIFVMKEIVQCKGMCAKREVL